MFYIFLFIFCTILPEVTLERLKQKYQNDYRCYQLEKHGSIFNHISQNHLLVGGTISAVTAYQTLKYKKPFNLDKLPGLLLPGSTAFLVEHFFNYLGNKEKERAAKNKTNNYDVLQACFEILEKTNTLGENDFIETLFGQFVSNQDQETYEKINKLVLNKEEHFILPQKIREREREKETREKREKEKREEREREKETREKREKETREEREREKETREKREKELHDLRLQEQQALVQKAELEKNKLEVELQEKSIVKIFDFETYNSQTQVRAFYGWEKYIEEKAARIISKINNQVPIKENTILYGAPGCGKTSYVENVTKEIAKQLDQDVTFYNIKNADLKTKTQNSATTHIFQLFDQVKAKAENNLVILFFDEFDGISTKRERHDEEKEESKIDHQNTDVTAMLLQEIETVANKKNIIVIGATNRRDYLDDAMIRNGRFDHRIHIGKPNLTMRKQIINRILNSAQEEKRQEERQEEILLLHLTSNQTSVDVGNTVKQYLKFKKIRSNEKNNEMNNKNDIVLFTENAIKSQFKRHSKSISQEIIEEKINEWINKNSFYDSSIEALKKEEANNNEIVSLEAIKDQEKYPSLQCNIEDWFKSEKINETKEDRMIRTLQELLKPLEELKGLPRRFNRIDNQLSDIKENQTATNEQLTNLIVAANAFLNAFLKEYQEQKETIKKIHGNILGANMLSEKICSHISCISATLLDLNEKTLTKENAKILEILIKNMLQDIDNLIKQALIENANQIFEKINKLQEAVNTINTFEEIKTLSKKIESTANEAKQFILAKSAERKVLLNTITTTAKHRETLAKEKMKHFTNIQDADKEKIAKFICLITTAYDFNEYEYFLETMLFGRNEEYFSHNVFIDVDEYNNKIEMATEKIPSLKELKNKLSLGSEHKIKKISKPQTLDEIWNNLLNEENYYPEVQNILQTSKEKLLNIVDTWTIQDLDTFNTVITTLIGSSQHQEQKEFDTTIFKTISQQFTEIDKKDIKDIITATSYQDHKEEFRYVSVYSNKSTDRIKHRIKFRIQWLLKNFKE